MIKIGVIGSNFVSDWMCETLNASADFELAAVYSRTQETGDVFAAKHGIPLVYTDMEAFLSSDLEAVYIASPNICHGPQAMDALRHGKHVLCEKPIATSAAEWKKMEKVAQENGRVLLEAMRPAFDPAILVARDALPLLGPIRRAVFEYCQYSSRYDRFKAGEVMNAFNPALGNAAIMDIGVYAVHVCLMLFGMPQEIDSRSVVFDNGMEAMGTIFMPYDGFQAEVVYAKIIDSVNPSVIIGENGSITIDKLSAPRTVTLRLRGEEPRVISPEPVELNMVYEVGAFADLIKRGEIDHPYKKISAMEMEILDTVRAQNGIEFR